MRTKPVLGRGLASLIPRPTVPLVGRQDDGVTSDTIANIDVGKIRPNPFQPRADFDPVELDELKRSIQEKGIIQPITVCRVDGEYQLISGERRLRASREAGLSQIPAYIIKIHSREELLELALIENLQRSNLNPIEIAISYKRLTEELNHTIEQVAQKTGKDRSTITNFLRLLKLPENIQTAVRKGDLSAGHARALITIDDPSLQLHIFHKIMSKGWSVREVEKAVRESGRSKARGKSARRSAGSTPSNALASIEEKLRQKLGTKVEVKDMADGKGHILIEYYSLDDLDRLLDLFATIES
ncbi:MAG: ParB/RepB/Spo0J family partition protein [Bacteroidetes bacterium]|nr:ParB/RepB/Spo0J family partition protein [Bacteroidota bacterium]MCW5895231.1 ParB/RepB/Spo0J family partition protein [Bacteroidota bacterium]